MAFFPLEKISQLHDGYQKAFGLEGYQLLLLQVDGQPYIIENRCPHMDVPLTHASQTPEGKIRCRSHGIEFDLQSGRAAGPLANQLECLKKFPVIYDGTMIGLEL
ncbi:Ferredoxin subunit of nitrite reductase or a ring-hydroxylating dioxygenase [Alteromonadaceae bacterium Bs31]|nr:Ferredoxin subunit of nitrite reductase or a ring-hydroxylating dioxygenase [Alteromonadaceae bacterium Bs31]